MKKLGQFVMLLLLCISCSNENGNLTDKNCRVILDFGADVSYDKTPNKPENKLGSKSVNLAPYQDINNYTVEFIKGSQILKTATYRDMELISNVEPGVYKFRAYYGQNPNAAWDQLYVAGEKEFTAEAGRTTSVRFTCTPANAKIKVVYDPTFDQYYSDCSIAVTTKYQTTPFVMTKADAAQAKEAYFKVDAGSNSFTLNFTLKNKEGVDVTPNNFGAQTINVKPRDFLTLTIKPNLVDVEGGKIDGINVTIDNSLTQNNQTIIVPDNFTKDPGIK